TDQYLRDLETMLKMKASFSIYMAHGGTSFGFTPGADRPFKPDTSSYDYDAPISEAGWTTDKFFKTRELFSRYLNPGETIPEPPAALPVIAFPATAPAGFAPLLAKLPAPVRSAQPLNFEKLDQPYGIVLFRTTIPAGPAAEFRADAVNDLGIAYLDGKRIGYFDRRGRTYSLRLPAREKPAVLEILVEAMGRVNFGQEVNDRKGLRGPVRLGQTELQNWEMCSLPLDDKQLGGLAFGPALAKTQPDLLQPGFHRFDVEIKKPGDTFIDMSPFGKGVAWVNGHNLGRYWNIGPQQTMFVPGAWLRPGRNTFVVLDLLAAPGTKLAALEKPILDQLRPELDTFAAIKMLPRRRVTGEPVQRGTFAPGSETQDVRFAKPVRARYFMLESLNAHDGRAFASVADLSLTGPDGRPLSSQAWTVAGVDSEENSAEAAGALNAIDGQTSNFWHSRYKDSPPAHPHWITIDLGREETIGGFIYTPRQGTEKDAVGRIKDYQAYAGNTLDVPAK
ncbi:MAG: beta-galactosidase, partial [Verrucomicrobiota bacterium]